MLSYQQLYHPSRFIFLANSRLFAEVLNVFVLNSYATGKRGGGQFYHGSIWHYKKTVSSFKQFFFILNWYICHAMPLPGSYRVKWSNVSLYFTKVIKSIFLIFVPKYPLCSLHSMTDLNLNIICLLTSYGFQGKQISWHWHQYGENASKSTVLDNNTYLCMYCTKRPRRLVYFYIANYCTKMDNTSWTV